MVRASGGPRGICSGNSVIPGRKRLWCARKVGTGRFFLLKDGKTTGGGRASPQGGVQLGGGWGGRRETPRPKPKTRVPTKISGFFQEVLHAERKVDWLGNSLLEGDPRHALDDVACENTHPGDGLWREGRGT